MGENEVAKLVDAIIRIASSTPAILDTIRIPEKERVFGEIEIAGFVVGIGKDGTVYQHVLARGEERDSAALQLAQQFPDLLKTGLSIAACVGFGSMTNPRRRRGQHPGIVRQLCFSIDQEFQCPSDAFEYHLTFEQNSDGLEFYDLLESYFSHGKLLIRSVRTLK